MAWDCSSFPHKAVKYAVMSLCLVRFSYKCYFRIKVCKVIDLIADLFSSWLLTPKRKLFKNIYVGKSYLKDFDMY